MNDPALEALLAGMPAPVSDSAIAGIGDVFQKGEDRSLAAARLQRALAQAAASDDEFLGGLGKANAVPSAWGPILVRQSPLMQIVKGIRSFKDQRAADSAEQDVTRLTGEVRTGLEGYEREKSRQAQAARERLANAIAARRQAAAAPNPMDHAADIESRLRAIDEMIGR